MADPDELAAFDEDLIADVAADHGLPADRLASLARTHQANVRALPGVDDIVYEWRTQFHRDPLLARTDRAYYLALPDHVWDEFAADLGITEAQREALVALHDRQARRIAPEAGIETSRLDGALAVVLVRP